MNRVTGKYSAVVDGKPTGLCGCGSTETCPKASGCLRSDDKLNDRFPWKPNTCKRFIPYQSAAL